MTHIKNRTSAALEFASRGFRVVHLHGCVGRRCTCSTPGCANIGRHPILKDHLGKATTAPKIIASRSRSYPESNIAVATGPASNLIIMDVDPRNGGDVSLAELAAECPQLYETVTVLTARGGRHFWFRPPPDLGSVAKTVLPGIDVLWEKAYAICPPSRTENGEYTFASGRGPDDVEIAPLPEPILGRVIQDMCRTLTGHVQDQFKTQTGTGGRVIEIQELKHGDVERLYKAIRDTIPQHAGTRHAQIFEFARQLRSLPVFEEYPASAFFDIVKLWHDHPLANAHEKGFGISATFLETWQDFEEGFGKVRRKYGDSLEPVVAGLIEIVQAADYPQPVLDASRAIYADTERELGLLTFLYLLDQHHEGLPFPFGADWAAK